jgi:uncharacterized damage-inducible protein DinB
MGQPAMNLSARMLTRYKAWSNQVMFDAVAALPPGEAVKERKSLFRNMVHTLNHNYVIDAIWQAHLQGRAHGYTARNTADHPPLAQLWTKQQAMDQWYITWGDALTEDALAEKLQFTLIGGNAGSMSRYDMLLHVVTHTSYHRGFVAAMFFEVPARPPAMDLPVFMREVPQA